MPLVIVKLLRPVPDEGSKSILVEVFAANVTVPLLCT